MRFEFSTFVALQIECNSICSIGSCRLCGNENRSESENELLVSVCFKMSLPVASFRAFERIIFQLFSPISHM